MKKPLARIGQRFTAQFIDGLAALAVAAVFYLVANLLGLSNVWLFGGWFLYILLCDGLPGGQSIGKRFTNTSAVHVDSDLPCSYFQSCVRNLSLVVLGIIDIAFIAGEQRRRLGDLIARTKVIQL